MTRDRLDDALGALRDAVCELAGLVLTRLRTALDALAAGDAATARAVVQGDDAVNERYLAVERRCVDLLALQQPVASDLRFVAASFKLTTDLERVGDLAVNLGRYALAARDPFAEVDLREIGEHAVGMLEDAVAAYREGGDAWRCHEVADRDTELDALCAHAGDVVVRALIEHDAVEAVVDDVTTLLLVVRDVERVGDHAVNIAARTLYMAESDDSLIY